MATLPRTAARVSKPLLALGYAGGAAFFLWTRIPLLWTGLWRDDGITIAIAQADTVGEFLRRLGFLDSQPPLYPASVAIWGRLFGFGEMPLKIYAFGWGVLAVAALVLLAYELCGAWAGLFTLLLAVNHPMLLWIAGDLRPYATSITLVAIALIAVFAGDRKPAAVRFAWLAPAMILLVYAQYTATMVGVTIGAAALIGCFGRIRRRRWRPVLAAAALAGALFLPWLPAVSRHMRIGLPWDTVRTFAEKLESFGKRGVQVFPWTLHPSGILGQLGLVLLLAASALGWSAVRRAFAARLAAYALLTSAAAVVFVVMTFAAEPLRYVSISAALGCVLLGGALAQVNASLRRGMAAAAARFAAVLIVAGAFLVSARDRADLHAKLEKGVAKSAARDLCRSGRFGDRDLVVAAPDFGATMFRYYCGDRLRLHGYPQWDGPEIPNWEGYRARWRAASVAETVDQVAKRLDAGEVDRVVVAWLREPRFLRLFEARRPLDDLKVALAKRFAQTGTRIYPGIAETFEITEYRKAPATIISAR